MFSCEYWEIFKNTYSEDHPQMAASILLIIKLVIKYWTSADLFLIDQKHNVEWFLLRKFVDLFRVYFLLLLI